MPQRSSDRLRGPLSDPCHSRESPPRSLLWALLPLVLLTPLIATPVQAQSRASLQVAATVLPAEPSRSALILVAQGLREPRWSVRESRLAQVTVMPSSRALPTEPRRVRIDFLRN